MLEVACLPPGRLQSSCLLLGILGHNADMTSVNVVP